MNNETKLNVFETIADKCAGYDDELYERYLKQYNDALPDDMPVIPEAIGEYIMSCKARMMDLHDSMFNWLRSREEDEFMDCYSETFARAWLLGIWRVEETGEIVKLEVTK